jgi:uncharacterized membrane protein (DUF485 family)
MEKNDAAVRSYEVISFVLVFLVGLTGVAIAAMFGLPLGLALVLLAMIMGLVILMRYVQHHDEREDEERKVRP